MFNVNNEQLIMYKKTTSIILSLIGTFLLGMPNANPAEIGVSPPRLEVEINGKTRTQSINIINLSNKPVELKASLGTWTLGENNQVQEIPSHEQSLDQWIVFTPPRFTIPPGRSQTIRFAVRPKVKPTPGEHRAVLYLEEIPSNRQDPQAVTTIARIGVLIYGYSGDTKRVGVLNSLTVNAKPNALAAVFDVSSQGNAHVRVKGQYAIWSATQYPGASTTKSLPHTSLTQAKFPSGVVDAGVLDVTPVLGGTRRQVTMPIPKKLPPGNYVLDINGELSGVAIDKGIPFTVPASTGTKPANSPKK